MIKLMPQYNYKYDRLMIFIKNYSVKIRFIFR